MLPLFPSSHLRQFPSFSFHFISFLSPNIHLHCRHGGHFEYFSVKVWASVWLTDRLTDWFVWLAGWLIAVFISVICHFPFSAFLSLHDFCTCYNICKNWLLNANHQKEATKLKKIKVKLKRRTNWVILPNLKMSQKRGNRSNINYSQKFKTFTALIFLFFWQHLTLALFTADLLSWTKNKKTAVAQTKLHYKNLFWWITNQISFSSTGKGRPPLINKKVLSY